MTAHRMHEYRRLLAVIALPLLDTLAAVADDCGKERIASVRRILADERDRAAAATLAADTVANATTESEGT